MKAAGAAGANRAQRIDGDTVSRNGWLRRSRGRARYRCRTTSSTASTNSASSAHNDQSHGPANACCTCARTLAAPGAGIGRASSSVRALEAGIAGCTADACTGSAAASAGTPSPATSATSIPPMVDDWAATGEGASAATGAPAARAARVPLLTTAPGTSVMTGNGTACTGATPATGGASTSATAWGSFTADAGAGSPIVGVPGHAHAASRTHRVAARQQRSERQAAKPGAHGAAFCSSLAWTWTTALLLL
ncbi:hypothetical protein RZA67_09505 [Stenotrophomonas sp. C3(2023)]|uniref:hypothetical protein n=1 Tax=Stenotrophomonas sp. C3(2023) TaxID=3080277 RepID=UPI00293C3EF2|nr:hypothetical protein [Stenotrophomonas sp. C3(2023)]MDV3468964.1 hypothetical protein [Stenotrophomonas sp. C3(2023)]